MEIVYDFVHKYMKIAVCCKKLKYVFNTFLTAVLNKSYFEKVNHKHTRLFSLSLSKYIA